MSLDARPDEVIGIPEGTVVGDRYRIRHPLTSGGMSAVFVADDLKYTGHRRAVKVMAPFLLKDAKSRARFEQEALIGRALKHPNIVDVLAAGVDPALQSPWIAMELLEGSTLADTVRTRGRIPAAELLDLYADFGSAIAAAHQAGAVHRDLKPENLFLEAKPTKSLPYTVKVLDFGIAKVRKDVFAQNSQVMGSPLWMAPEQLSHGTAIGPFTDVWPFGLIAFFALVGKPYWLVANEPAMNLPKLLAELMAADLVPPSQRAAELGVDVALSPEFDAWFLHCVERDHARRFPTIADATGALHRALEPVVAPPPAPAAEPPSAPVRASEPIVLPTSSRGPIVALAVGVGLIAAALLAWLFTR